MKLTKSIVTALTLSVLAISANAATYTLATNKDTNISILAKKNLIVKVPGRLGIEGLKSLKGQITTDSPLSVDGLEGQIILTNPLFETGDEKRDKMIKGTLLRHGDAVKIYLEGKKINFRSDDKEMSGHLTVEINGESYDVPFESGIAISPDKKIVLIKNLEFSVERSDFLIDFSEAIKDNIANVNIVASIGDSAIAQKVTITVDKLAFVRTK